MRNRPRAALAVLAALLTAGIADALWRMPVQVYDAMAEVLDAAQSPSVVQAFVAALKSNAYLRPLRIAQIKALFDLSGGDYHLAYRGFHVLLAVAAIWLFHRALRVRTWTDFAAGAFALLALTGSHTFPAFVREAYPINHFLEIAVFWLAAINLAESRRGWAVDVAIATITAAALLTLESGVLVWVAVGAAWLAGAPAISRRTFGVVTVLLVAYFIVRLEVLSTGIPGLTERASGFLLARLEPEELQQRFGAAPWLFYAYNVTTALVTMLAAEPSNGQFVALGAALDGRLEPRMVVATLAALGTTMIIGIAVARRLRIAAPFDPVDRLAIVGGATVLASAALGYAYAKDDILAVGGIGFAFAAFAAMRLLMMQGGGPVAGPRVWHSAAVLLLATLWATQSFGLHQVLRAQAARVRNDWAEVPMLLHREGRWPQDPVQVRVLETLRADALASVMPRQQQVAEWQKQWFGD